VRKARERRPRAEGDSTMVEAQQKPVELVGDFIGKIQNA
jgi:hypothetical protein